MRSNRRGRGRDRSRDDQTPATPVNWRRLFSYLSPYKLRMVIAIIALAFYSAAGLIFPLVIGQLLNSVFQPQNQNQFDQLNTITLSLLTIFLVQAAISFVQSYNLTYIGERIVLDL